MKDIRGIKGKFYIASLIEEGEYEHQDFKFAVSDARKIARSLSAFANNDGGRLLIGVKDNGAIAGVRNEEDIFVVEQAAEMYCEPPQEIKVTAFKAEGGHTVMRVEIGRAPIRPVHVKETGGELRAYYRVRDENIAAPPLLVRAWKHASGNEGSIIEVNSQGRMLLEMASDSDGVTIEGFMLAAHVSRQTAEDIAVSLYGMGLIEFMYNGTCFTLKSL
ncbi:helix-turn-helix domain-containing protein [Duncaniella freteri]|uniref:AlbA family DNA-binding domain-containing protein n=2 Tax=Duncaniella TaxID=2518495 RepID=UPI001482262A|nr:ATP-binding protein [Duncaniella freteri]